MRGVEYAELAAFVAVVDQGSFVRGAAHLGMAPSSLSATIKKLEQRLGVELLHRTTRSVSMTGAGVRLFNRFKPAMTEMEAAVFDLHRSSAAPIGLVRIHIPRPAYASLFEGRLGELHRSFPNIQLDITVDDALINIATAGFDLDIRLGGTVDPSTSAIPIGGGTRHVVVASPAYFGEHRIPETPADLAQHRCIHWRRPETEHPYRWVFQIDGCTTPVDVEGPLIVSHCDVAVIAALESVGIAFVLEQHAIKYLGEGTLISLLESFLPILPGWSICYPRKGRRSAAANALIEFLVRHVQTQDASREIIMS